MIMDRLKVRIPGCGHNIDCKGKKDAKGVILKWL